MTDEQLEAAAKAVMIEDGCGLMVNGKQVLCDDPALGREMITPCMCRNQARAALTAAGVKPRVKPLVWKSSLNGDVFALSICGTYSIQFYDQYASLQLPGQKLADREDWVTVADAKAAAQADYEARILSALTTEGE